jgi:hypothetical protein
MQEDMTNFRFKLASILLTSELNNASGLTQTNYHDDGSPFDIQIVEIDENETSNVSRDMNQFINVYQDVQRYSCKTKRSMSPFENANKGGISKGPNIQEVIYTYE